MDSAERMVGNWRLSEWTASVNGRRVRPFGGVSTGLLIYTADGRMSATLMRTDREDLDSGTLAAAKEHERAHAAAGYISYGGRWYLSGDIVTHEVEVSLFPDWIGGKQLRRVKWLGDDLELSTPEEHSQGGATVVNRLTWQRIRE